MSLSMSTSSGLHIEFIHDGLLPSSGACITECLHSFVLSLLQTQDIHKMETGVKYSKRWKWDEKEMWVDERKKITGWTRERWMSPIGWRWRDIKGVAWIWILIPQSVSQHSNLLLLPPPWTHTQTHTLSSIFTAWQLCWQPSTTLCSRMIGKGEKISKCVTQTQDAYRKVRMFC